MPPTPAPWTGPTSATVPLHVVTGGSAASVTPLGARVVQKVRRPLRLIPTALVATTRQWIRRYDGSPSSTTDTGTGLCPAGIVWSAVRLPKLDVVPHSTCQVVALPFGS